MKPRQIYIVALAFALLALSSCTTIVSPDGTRTTTTDPNAIRILGEVLVEKAK